MKLEDKFCKLFRLCENQGEFGHVRIVKCLSEKWRKENKMSDEERNTLNKLFKEYKIPLKDFERLY